jgi:hypothetical protein
VSESLVELPYVEIQASDSGSWAGIAYRMMFYVCWVTGTLGVTEAEQKPRATPKGRPGETLRDPGSDVV